MWHVQPLPFAVASCAVFTVGMAVVSKAVAGDKLRCLDEDESSLAGDVVAEKVEAMASGVALCGMLAIAGGAVVTRALKITSLRIENLYVAGIICLEMFVYYQLVSYGALAHMCVAQLGGLSHARRPVIVGRYVSWLCSMPVMTAVFGKQSDAPTSSIRRAVCMQVLMFVSVLVLTTVDSSFAVWLLAFLSVMLLNSVVMFYVWKFLRCAYASSSDVLTRSLLQRIGPAFLIIWLTFPIVGAIVTFDGMDPHVERITWACQEILLKVSFLMHALIGDFSSTEEQMDIALREVEEGRHLAEASNNAKRSIMQYLFHELRVPLNSMLLGVEELRASFATDAATELCDIVSDGITSMTRLLDDFLSLEKAEAGKLVIEMQAVPLRHLLHHTVRAFAALLDRRSLSTSIVIARDLPALVTADPHRHVRTLARAAVHDIHLNTTPCSACFSLLPVVVPLPSSRIRQCISNFLSNAVKFASSGSVVTIEASQLRRSSATSVTGVAGGTTPPLEGVGEGAVLPLHFGPRARQQSTCSSDDTVGKAAAQELDGGGALTLRIAVTNEGSGLSHEEQARLFMPFSQIRPGVQQRAGGTGLGLAITRRIVELHGGVVGVTSVVGASTTFFFEVPLGTPSDELISGLRSRMLSHSPPVTPLARWKGALSPPAPTEWQHCLSQRIETPAPAGNPISTAVIECHLPGQVEVSSNAASTTERSFVLRPPPPELHPTGAASRRLISAIVVDDVASNRMLFARLLRRRGVLSVLEMAGGMELLAAWSVCSSESRAGLQAVFCDKEMPNDLDGHETAAALRREGFTGAIIGVTGNALDGDRAAFIAAGADAVVPKPVKITQLEASLAAVGLALSS